MCEQESKTMPYMQRMPVGGYNFYLMAVWAMYLLGEVLSNRWDHFFLGRSRRQILHVMELPVFLQAGSLQLSIVQSSKIFPAQKGAAQTLSCRQHLHLALKSQLSAAASWRHAGALVRWVPTRHQGAT